MCWLWDSAQRKASKEHVFGCLARDKKTPLLLTQTIKSVSNNREIRAMPCDANQMMADEIRNSNSTRTCCAQINVAAPACSMRLRQSFVGMKCARTPTHDTIRHAKMQIGDSNAAMQCSAQAFTLPHLDSTCKGALNKERSDLPLRHWNLQRN